MQTPLEPRPFKEHLLTMPGFSAKQIKHHFEIVYKNYIKSLNQVRTKLGHVPKTNQNSRYSEFRCLKEEETYNLDAIVLHELYFENLGGKGSKPSELLTKTLEKDFGSFKNWETDFLATAGASRAWAALCLDLRDFRLHNYLFDAHNEGIVSSASILLIIDVSEHAYYIDYPSNLAGYVTAFMQNIDWHYVNYRFEAVAKYLNMVNLSNKQS